MYGNVIKLREEVISPRVRFAMAYQFLDLISSYENEKLDILRDAQSLIGYYTINDSERCYCKKEIKKTLEPVPSETKNKVYLLLNGKAAFFLYGRWRCFYNDYYRKTFIERLSLKENTFYLIDDLK